MKTIFSTLAISLLLLHDGYAQSLAAVTLPKEQAVSSFAMNFPQRPHPGPIVTIGAIALPLGVILVPAGALVYYSGADTPYPYTPNKSEMTTGIVMMIAGAVMAPTGLGMIIGGAIHNHKMRKHGMSIVAPRSNQVGLAYNF